MTTKVGFVGLGEMGKGMAKNLVTKGFDLTVYDVSEEPVKELKQLGAKEAKSLKELAATTDVIFSMVRDDAQTEAVMWGKDGILDGIRSGSTIIINSTLTPSLVQKLAADAAKKGVGVLDSPVSGARTKAEAGTLTLLVGGDESLFKKMEPILKVVGQNIFYMGSVGMGEVAKLANNMILFSSMASTTEGLAFAVKAGFPVKTILDFINVSTGVNWAAQNWELMTSFKKDHSPLATLNLMYKDLNLGLKYAKEIGVELPLASQFGQIDLWREVAG